VTKRGAVVLSVNVKEEMAPEEVVANVGPPHKQYAGSDGEETWAYFHDALAWNYSGVRFNQDGRARSSWLH